MQNSIFDQMDFGPLQEFLDDDDVTDVSVGYADVYDLRIELRQQVLANDKKLC